MSGCWGNAIFTVKGPYFNGTSTATSAKKEVWGARTVWEYQLFWFMEVQLHKVRRGRLVVVNNKQTLSQLLVSLPLIHLSQSE